MPQNKENRDGARDKGRRKKRSENERTRSGWPSASDPNLLTSTRMNLSRRCTSLIFDLLSDAAFSLRASVSHLAECQSLFSSFSLFLPFRMVQQTPIFFSSLFFFSFFFYFLFFFLSLDKSQICDYNFLQRIVSFLNDYRFTFSTILIIIFFFLFIFFILYISDLELCFSIFLVQ
ncbi:hypothetical protein PUN28_005363 [Cardiocondyla obscurior]|uniref:Transmembrane protein n=1 Tax=Cardiocondyla obscurior TaxID=286306 RepID=A0AAW2GFH8_9HYME